MKVALTPYTRRYFSTYPNPCWNTIHANTSPNMMFVNRRHRQFIGRIHDTRVHLTQNLHTHIANAFPSFIIHHSSIIIIIIIIIRLCGQLLSLARLRWQQNVTVIKCFIIHCVQKKTPTYVFDYNSCVSWSIFILFVTVEIGMNTLQFAYLQS